MVFPPTSPLYSVVLHNTVIDPFVDFRFYYDCSIGVICILRGLGLGSRLCFVVAMSVGLDCSLRGPDRCPYRALYPILDGQ